MEYASVIWDPYYNSDRDKLESIQRRAARWTSSDYSRTSSVSLMLHQLSWPTLQIQRNISRLQLFHKIFHLQIYIPVNPNLLPTCKKRHTTLSPLSFHSPTCINHITSTIRHFFSRTIKERNNLSTSILDTTDYDTD